MKVLYNEDNQSIEKLIDCVNEKVVKIRKEGKLTKNFINKLNQIYNDYVNNFYENYVLKNIETGEDYEKEMVNVLLELITFLNKIDNE